MSRRTVTVTGVAVVAALSGGAAWLAHHDGALSADEQPKYLNTAESGQPGVYDRIRLRTDLIAKLTAPL